MEREVRTGAAIRAENQTGATMLEYVLLLSLIALVALTGVARLGNATRGTFVTIRDQLAQTSLPADPDDVPVN